MPPSDVLRPGLALLALIAATFAVFAIWPGIDPAISALFYVPGEGYPAARFKSLDLIRSAIWNLTLVMVFAALVFGGASALLKREFYGIPARLWAYVLALSALGPGLLVNGILKSNWGRARPATVEGLGGTALFTPPHVISDQCVRNCSFVSGEVAGATALAVAIWMLAGRLAPRLPRGGVPALRVMAVALPVLIAYQRIATGRHFLSDAILAVLLTLLLAVLLRPILPPALRGPSPQG